MTKRQTLADIKRLQRQHAAWSKSVERLEDHQDRLSSNVRQLKAEIRDLRTQHRAEALKRWNNYTPILSLVAGDEPGVLTVNSALHTPSGVMQASKEFQIINVCYALPHMAPLTMRIWRGCLQTACDILDNALAGRME